MLQTLNVLRVGDITQRLKSTIHANIYTGKLSTKHLLKLILNMAVADQ